MKNLFKALLLTAFAFAGTSAFADPIGGPNDPPCATCFGSVYTLEYVADTNDPLHFTISLTIDTSDYSGAGSFISAVSIKVASQIEATSGLTTPPPGTGTWTDAFGQVNSATGDCSGGGSGWLCASSTDNLAVVGDGLVYTWIFDVYVDNINRWMLDSLEASIKANYDPPEGLITSENITLQNGGPPNETPEPQTLALLGLGLLALAYVRRRRVR